MNYINFLDETGDHNLQSIDGNFPVFCLAGCVFESRYYHYVVRPRLDAFKIRFWNTTDFILHSRDIRRQQGAFSFLRDATRRKEFNAALNELIEELKFTILVVVILKQRHLDRYGPRARHPYHLALTFMMERYAMLMGYNNHGYILADSRGKQPDRLLKAEYQRLKSTGTDFQFDFANITSFWMEKKEANIAGLQIADLVAYPIAAKVLRPTEEQKAFDILFKKINAAPPEKGSSILGYGLKIFPQPMLDHYQLWG
jgi:hypothetical protein